MVDEPVEELECARAEQEAAPGQPARQGTAPTQVGEPEEPADQGDHLGGVQQPVREQRHRRGGAVVEVVPGKQLVKDDLVHRGHDRDADQDADEGGGTTVGDGSLAG